MPLLPQFKYPTPHDLMAPSTPHSIDTSHKKSQSDKFTNHNTLKDKLPNTEHTNRAKPITVQRERERIRYRERVSYSHFSSKRKSSRSLRPHSTLHNKPKDFREKKRT